MRGKRPDFHDLRHAFRRIFRGNQRAKRIRNILLILAAARIRSEGGRRKRNRTTNSVIAHLANRIGEERSPVPIAPINRDRDYLAQLGDQRAILVVNRTTAIKVIIMFGDLEQSLAGYIAPA